MLSIVGFSFSIRKQRRNEEKKTENDTKVCFILLCIKYSINLCKIDLFSLEKRAKTDVFGLKLPFSVLKPFNINCVQQKRIRYVEMRIEEMEESKKEKHIASGVYCV